MLTLTEAAANAACRAVTDALNGGQVRLYDGMRPLRADAPVTSQRLLASWTLGDPAFKAPARGASVATAIKPAIAVADGQATWFRVVPADGSIGYDGTAAESAGDLVLSSATVTAGAMLLLSTLVYRARME